MALSFTYLTELDQVLPNVDEGDASPDQVAYDQARAFDGELESQARHQAAVLERDVEIILCTAGRRLAEQAKATKR